MLPQLPSKAFGDGSHPTTRLCMKAVHLLARGAVLDVGTGTGILARIARARGATSVHATDIDDLALAAARANAALDAHPTPIAFGRDLPAGRFDLIVANILQAPLVLLAPALCDLLAPRGRLLLSGFTQAESPVIRVAYARLSLHSEATLDGWVLAQYIAPPHA